MKIIFLVQQILSSFSKKEIKKKNEIMMMRLSADEFVCSFSIISLILHFLQVLRKIMFMGYIGCKSPPSISSTSAATSPLVSQMINTTTSVRSRVVISTTPKGTAGGGNCDDSSLTEENLLGCKRNYSIEEMKFRRKEVLVHNNNMMGSFDQSKVMYCRNLDEDSDGILVQDHKRLLNSSGDDHDEEMEVKLCSNKARKRPARLVIPVDSHSGMKFGGGDHHQRRRSRDFEVKGRDYCLASRRGIRKEVMEDGYGIISDIKGDRTQAFFGVFDGHGGCAAMEYVAKNLGNNIITNLAELGLEEDKHHHQQLEKAIREGYLRTDKDFLCQDVSSGVCAATVLSKDGELYVANVGDCRVVLSRNGVAHALTSDHHVDREDERFRIENSGGYLNCRNGVWRVQGSLAVSRAIGDLHLKEWIISEPEIHKLRLTSDCEFLVIASDGLWDKVTNQEAVDVILRDKNSIESCKKLVNISSDRGNNDDITVMVVDLKNFRAHKGTD